ncbi:MAG: DUF1015 domain-containing protein [Clostridia bacterium]|nr:DUF1015 domain-containing protein [Clostridia bacterium]
MSVLKSGDFLLPKDGFDKWAVVACDQYTSSPEYWENVKAKVGDAPSALNLICPEVYLSSIDERKEGIKQASEAYVKILSAVCGMIFVRRTIEAGERDGLVCLVDLEAYSYERRDTLVRATEGTVIERIPPRLKVRKSSRLDLSHVICLIDDEKKSVVEKAEKGEKLYDVDLGKGGRLEGWLVANTAEIEKALDAMEAEAVANNRPFVLVGDGNHSLASAKALYEELKNAGDERAERARYAIVEVENLRSNAIVFEPIHRALFNANGFAEYLENKAKEKGASVEQTSSGLVVKAYSEIEVYRITQSIIDEYLASNKGASVDYIHGEDELLRLKANGAITVKMPSISKAEFFDYVAKNGNLPRKTFSMGEAYEKRYYMEARDIGRS